MFTRMCSGERWRAGASQPSQVLPPLLTRFHLPGYCITYASRCKTNSSNVHRMSPQYNKRASDLRSKAVHHLCHWLSTCCACSKPCVSHVLSRRTRHVLCSGAYAFDRCALSHLRWHGTAACASCSKTSRPAGSGWTRAVFPECS
jgi:hypothetical protein